MKKWHTNKTQPNFKQHYHDSIIIIWKNKDITVSGFSIDDFNKLYIIDEGYNNPLWKDIKEDIKYWAYVSLYFQKELNECGESK